MAIFPIERINMRVLIVFITLLLSFPAYSSTMGRKGVVLKGDLEHKLNKSSIHPFTAWLSENSIFIKYCGVVNDITITETSGENEKRIINFDAQIGGSDVSTFHEGAYVILLTTPRETNLTFYIE